MSTTNLPIYIAKPIYSTGPVYYSGAPMQLTVPSGSPGGTYTESCQQITMQGDTLTALCQRVDGSWTWSTLPNVSQYVPGSIYNQNGVLGGQLNSPGVNTVNVPGVGTVATGVDPNTGQVFTSIPPSGPQPPGAGFEAIEQSGPFPYVYTGGGTVAGQNAQGLPWNPITNYNSGDTVTYQGLTWQAVSAVPAGVYPGLAGYWQSFGGSAALPAIPQRTLLPIQPSGSSGGLGSFSSFASKYWGWGLAALGAAIFVPRLLRAR